MDHLFYPRKKFREWRERQSRKCTVKINCPKMKIKGKTLWNNAADVPYTESYVAFLGIPYALAPVGHLRFRSPLPLTDHHPLTPKLVKAYNSYHPCLQFTERGTRIIGSEDCLYLNLYVPKKPEEIPELLPVLVYIHGGGFSTGNNAMEVIQPDNMMRHDLILVIVNYRLGPFGFLNMGTDKCRGNAGLKDQVRALKWIRDNIENFKGDPKNVTICGHSAGATCVNLHLFSPLSRGLFHRAIIMSGGIYCPWGFKTLQHVQMVRRIFQKSVKAEAVGRVAVVKVLRDMKVKRLLMTTRKIMNSWARLQPTKLMGVLGPSEEHISRGAFIPRKPLERLMEEATPVSTIAGITEQEGYMYFFTRARGTWTEDDYMKLVKNPACFTKFLQQNLGWSKETTAKRRDELLTKYFGDAETLKGMDFHAVQGCLATFLTDLWFHRFYDTVKIGKERPASKPLYIYQYDYQTDYDRIRVVGKVKVIQDGPGHGDEIYYMFSPDHIMKQMSRLVPEETIHFTRNLCSLWANFCKNGNPKSEYEEVEWTAYSEDNPSYLSIGRELTVRPGRLKKDSWPKLREIILSEPVSELTLKQIKESFRLQMRKTWRRVE